MTWAPYDLLRPANPRPIDPLLQCPGNFYLSATNVALPFPRDDGMDGWYGWMTSPERDVEHLDPPHAAVLARTSNPHGVLVCCCDA